MKPLFAFAIAACVLAAHAADAPGAPAKKAVSFTLEPGKVHEECLRLEAGDKRKFRWQANVPVDFNVHYHEGKEVFFPVKRDGKRGDGGTFTAKIAHDYCWMWTAKSARAKVEGSIAPGK
ncbi:MAG: hypothetical protein ABIR98_16010 [Usitatibacter sp.]